MGCIRLMLHIEINITGYMMEPVNKLRKFKQFDLRFELSLI